MIWRHQTSWKAQFLWSWSGLYTSGYRWNSISPLKACLFKCVPDFSEPEHTGWVDGWVGFTTWQDYLPFCSSRFSKGLKGVNSSSLWVIDDTTEDNLFPSVELRKLTSYICNLIHRERTAVFHILNKETKSKERERRFLHHFLWSFCSLVIRDMDLWPFSSVFISLALLYTSCLSFRENRGSGAQAGKINQDWIDCVKRQAQEAAIPYMSTVDSVWPQKKGMTAHFWKLKSPHHLE